MSKETIEGDKPNKTVLPWTDKERNIIVNHVMTHVLATVGYGNIFGELPDILAKEGCPIRNTQAVSMGATTELAVIRYGFKIVLTFLPA